MPITVGSQVRLSYKIYDANGAFTNPATASLLITLPDGITTASPALSLPPAVTGNLIYDYVTLQPGRHTVYWSTTGPTTTGTSVFNVEPVSDSGLFSLSEARNFLNEMNPDVDSELLEMIYVTTEIVESKVGPVVPKTYSEKVDSGWRLPLYHGPIISVTSIAPYTPGLGGETVTSGFTIDPNAWVIDRATGFFSGPYLVTYVAGRRVVSHSIIFGAKLVLKHLWSTQRGPSLVGPGPSIMQDDTDTFSVNGRLYTVPRAVMEMLAPEGIGPQIG